jgi:uncharacterized membrane protein
VIRKTNMLKEIKEIIHTSVYRARKMATFGLDRATMGAVAGASFGIIVEILGSGKDAKQGALSLSLAAASVALPLAAYIFIYLGGLTDVKGASVDNLIFFISINIALNAFIISVAALVYSLSELAFLALVVTFLGLTLSLMERMPDPPPQSEPPQESPPP